MTSVHSRLRTSPLSWNTAAVELTWIEDESPRLQDVLKLHRRFAAVLGFMPTQGFTARAASGTLLIAIVDDATAGYALYDLPRNEIALRHLCVDHPFQGHGIARALVDGIADKHSDRTGIRVRCRRDWSASVMWPQLGFEPLSDTPGRSAEGHLLTVWWRDFGHPTLFSHPYETEPATTVALDTNIVIDLLTMREDSAESQQLLSDWVADYVQLVDDVAQLEGPPVGGDVELNVDAAHVIAVLSDPAVGGHGGVAQPLAFPASLRDTQAFLAP